MLRKKDTDSARTDKKEKHSTAQHCSPITHTQLEVKNSVGNTFFFQRTLWPTEGGGVHL